MRRYDANTIENWFDTLQEYWESRAARQNLATVLIGGFFISLVATELSRLGWLPGGLGDTIPGNHFYAIDVAFTLFLIFEVIALVFGLATSVSDAAGKQLEILSLILLRQSFKELVDFEEEPIEWSLDNPEAVEAVQLVVVDATGALVIFAIVGWFYYLQVDEPFAGSKSDLRQFIIAKKAVCLLLLAAFAVVGIYAVYTFLVNGIVYPVFPTIFTILIFSDVLIVFIALRYSTQYHIVFRNSGFAVATVLIRLALAGPRYFDVLIGIGAALFAAFVMLAYNYASPSIREAERRNRSRVDGGGKTDGGKTSP